MDIDYIKPHIDNIQTVLHSARYFCTKNNVVNDLECENMFMPLLSMFNDISRDYHAISHLIQSKSKRSAWISGIGTILKHIIGTMDENDAIRYNKAIQILKDNNRKTLDLIKENILISKSAIITLNESIIEINTNEHKLNKMIENLSSSIKNLTKASNALLFKSTIHDMINVIQSNMLNLSYKLEDIINSILFSKTNTLHPSVITPKDLYYDLVNNVKYLPRYSELAVSLELENIYVLINLSEIITCILENKLIFSLKIPLVLIDTYTLYKTVPIPVPHNVTSKSFALILPTCSYVALNQRKSKYLKLDNLSKCKSINKETHICKQLDEIDIQDYPICETEIMTKVLKSLPKQCKTKFLYGHANIWQSLNNNRWVFTLSEPTKLNIECTDETTEYIVSGTGILSLKPNCTGFCKNIKLISKSYPEYKFSHIHSEFNLVNDTCCNPAVFENYNYTESITGLHNLESNNLDQIINKADNMLQTLKHLKSQNESISISTPHSIVTYLFVILFVIFICYYFCHRKCVAFVRKSKPNENTTQINTPPQENIQLNTQPRIRIH